MIASVRHTLFRQRTLLAAVLSAALLFAGAVAGHVHDDGLPHYADCDICLQVSGVDTAHSAGTVPPPVIRAGHATPVNVVPATAERRETARARAPPLAFSH